MRKMRFATEYVLALALLVSCLASAAAAQTGAPRANGKIAFVVYKYDGQEHSGISVINPDGSGRSRLTFTQILCPPPNRPPDSGCGPDHLDYSPAWSPDGKQIAFVRSRPVPQFRYEYEIFVMNADGSNLRWLTQFVGDVGLNRPAWSPDGARIAFSAPGLARDPMKVWLINADGTGAEPLVTGTNPAWSPDGTKLAMSYDGIYVSNANGTGLTKITNPQNLSRNLSDYDGSPVWTPDGTKISFIRWVGCDFDGACGNQAIWAVNADGSNPARIVDVETTGFDWSPDGTKIALSATEDLVTMNADGTGITKITNTHDEVESMPSWQSVATAPAPAGNPIDDPEFFIRQHYLDFLGREPDPAGLAGWLNILNNCGITVPQPCDRIEVSSAFFRSPEFQGRSYFIYRFYPTIGKVPIHDEFTPDFARVSGFLTDQQLEAAKAAFVADFMARSEFQSRYASTFSNPTAYVDALLQTVGLPNHPARQAWINSLQGNNSPATRAQVLRALVESNEVYQKYYNEAFVVMQYFGYLRRTADAAYLDWTQTMDQNGGDYRTMINGFVNSIEYRQRFGL